MTEIPTYEYDIFLSHNHNDEVWTGQLAARLEQESWQGRKLKVFFSPWDIRPGQSIPKELEKALPKSRKVGLVMTPEAMSSAWVELERLVITHIDISERQERLIPLYLRACDMPALLKPILPVDFRDATKFEEGYQKLLAVIKDEPIPRGSRAPSNQNLSMPLSLTRPPAIGFVTRRDKAGRNILERLRDELAPNRNQLIALWGAGGVGKTTLAAEAARGLTEFFKDRIIWVNADGRPDFAFSTLLDEIADRLGRFDLRKLSPEHKQEEVSRLAAAAPTLIVLDNFETIAPKEQTACADFLIHFTSCPALITTRQNINGAQNIPIDAMSVDEAREFVARFINQEAHDPQAFAGQDHDQIIKAAEANPLILQWVLALIDLAQEPQEVIDELIRGEGDAAQRVFDRSFDLPQLGDDGRAALLALSLFAPSASRQSLAEVAGFGKNNPKRLNEAVKSLASLWLVRTADGNQQLKVEGLTRELARSRLSKHKNAEIFRRRFVSYFTHYAESHTSKDFKMLEAEKNNILIAMDVAFEQKDWKRVMRMMDVMFGLFHTRGYWDEAIQYDELALNAARNSKNDGKVAHFAHNVADIYQHRGSFAQARRLYNENLAIHKRHRDSINVAATLHQLGLIAHGEGNLIEAQRYYDESLEIERQIQDQGRIAVTLHQLGLVNLDKKDFQQAEYYLDQSLSILRTLNDEPRIAECIESIGKLRIAQGRFPEADSLLAESLTMAETLSDQFRIGSVKYSLGVLKGRQGDKAEARRLDNDALTIFEQLGSLDSPEAKSARRLMKELEDETS